MILQPLMVETMTKLFYFLLYCFSSAICTSQLYAQTMHKETLMQMASFTSPLDGKLYISGTFGEPRPNHYHSGLDFKTNQEIGKKVYAADAGYISRIKVSAYGYGHALYMNHPSNLTTVYAHLDEFSEPIKQWVKSIQYELQSFEIDTVLKEKLFLFEKGDQIALSGNSGGSAGPHLHFELRNTYSEVAINPMAFLKVEDQTPPTINQLRIYPIQNSFFDHKGIPVRLKPTSKNSWSGGFVEVPEGEIILSLQAFDQQDLTLNKNGIPTVKMFVNGQLVFLRQKDSINFSESKYANATIDYHQKVKNGVDYYLATLLPNNFETDSYSNSPTSGRIKIQAGEKKKIEIYLIDFHQNTTKVTVEVKGLPQKTSPINYLADHLSSGMKELDGASIYWKSHSFYDLIPDKLNLSQIKKSSFSKTYDIFREESFPIHKNLEIVFNHWTAPQHLHDKLIVVGENIKGKKKIYPTTLDGKNIKSAISEAALVYLDVDTIGPRIQLLNFQNSSQSFSQNKISVRITDDKSGIQSYNGYIDGQWVLFEYDAKNDLLEHHLDNNLVGFHELKIKVADRTNNITEKTVRFKK